ncbi:MAG: hypothetical protein LBH47_00350 [Christensenellaceae bacterium]|jgi:hypothetical protein|nr:hypothetical protein [Christensenellaceae bacterium]
MKKFDGSGLLDVLMYVFIAIGALAGVYAAYLGFLMGTATDESKRKAAKDRILKVLSSVMCIIVLSVILGTVSFQLSGVDGEKDNENNGGFSGGDKTDNANKVTITVKKQKDGTYHGMITFSGEIKDPTGKFNRVSFNGIPQRDIGNGFSIFTTGTSHTLLYADDKDNNKGRPNKPSISQFNLSGTFIDPPETSVTFAIIVATVN